MKDGIHKSERQILVAVDMGSSGIRAMAATANENGTLHILGMETIAHAEHMQKGVVVQSTTAAGLINKVSLLLKNRIGQSFDSAFVTVGGQLQVVNMQVKRLRATASNVTSPLLKEMRMEVVRRFETTYPQMKVVSAEPVCYLLDGAEQYEEPSEEQRAKEIGVRYDLFVSKSEAVEKLEGAFMRANKSVDFRWAQPEAHMTALMGDDERERGCAIIDFGAQTTTLTVCRYGRCLFTKVIPFGAYHVTHDIEVSQQVSFNTAEKVKRMFGVAAEAYVKENRMLRMTSLNPQNPVCNISTKALAVIIQARLVEILNPLMAELDNYESQIAKVCLTGGGAMLSGLVAFVQQRTSLPVDYGSHADWLESDAEQEYYKPVYSALVGTLALAADYRRKEPVVKLTNSPFKKLWNKTINRTIDLFTDTGDSV